MARFKPTRFMAEDSKYNKKAADYAVSFIECLSHTPIEIFSVRPPEPFGSGFFVWNFVWFSCTASAELQRRFQFPHPSAVHPSHGRS